MGDRTCLQCGESQGAVRASQRIKDPIYCAAVDYFGEVEWEMNRHRFRDWSDKELIEGWWVLPEHADKYRRIRSAYDIDPDHRLAPGGGGGDCNCLVSGYRGCCSS